MATIRLPPDFREFLRLLSAADVAHLIVGGYAVAYHGYPRATVDLDIWVRPGGDNAEKVARAVRDFGFETPDLSPDLFSHPGQIVRMGVPPLRIELMTTIDGVDFDACDAARADGEIDGVPVRIISLSHLRQNKRACGRHRDLNDLENLPPE